MSAWSVSNHINVAFDLRTVKLIFQSRIRDLNTILVYILSFREEINKFLCNDSDADDVEKWIINRFWFLHSLSVKLNKILSLCDSRSDVPKRLDAIISVLETLPTEENFKNLRVVYGKFNFTRENIFEIFFSYYSSMAERKRRVAEHLKEISMFWNVISPCEYWLMLISLQIASFQIRKMITIWTKCTTGLQNQWDSRSSNRHYRWFMTSLSSTE